MWVKTKKNLFLVEMTFGNMNLVKTLCGKLDSEKLISVKRLFGKLNVVNFFFTKKPYGKLDSVKCPDTLLKSWLDY